MTIANQDAEQLRLLSILYYVWAGLTALFSCFGAISMALVFFGVVASSSSDGAGPPPAAVGGILALAGGAMLLFALATAALSGFAGRSLSRRRHYVFCLVAAGLACLSFPLGTALGVFTFMVLQRPSVKALFGPSPAAVA